MRLGLIGPSDGDLATLARAARFLLDEALVDRVIYLGLDHALDNVVSAWAEELVGGDPSEDLVFERASRTCTDADPSVIEAFVASERARRRLVVFTTVPKPPGRTVELFDAKVAVIVYDKAMLDEDDIAGAAILVFGKADKAVHHRVGSRVFVAPGPLAMEGGGGIAVISDDQGVGVVFELRDSSGAVTQTERFDPRLLGTKMRVQ